MYQKIITLVLVSLIILNCSNEDIPNEQSDHQTPEVLQENEKYTWSSKRVSYDIVDQLFQEALEKDQLISDAIFDMKKALEHKNEVVKEFTDFDYTNRNYYDLASKYIDQINDSTLQKRMEIDNKRLVKEYKDFSQAQFQLVDSINSANEDMEDQLVVLKLAVTQKMMETFLFNEIPETEKMQNILKKLRELDLHLNVLIP